MPANRDGVVLKAEAARTLAFGSISGTYADVGSVTANPVRIIMVKNLTDVAVTVSADDGTTDWFDLPANGADTIDVFTNGGPDGAYLPVGSQFQVKDQGSGAASGKVVIQCYYVE